ncbi:hypothetical protein GCM10027030_24560 [Luteococcus sediminum]
MDEGHRDVMGEALPQHRIDIDVNQLQARAKLLADRAGPRFGLFTQVATLAGDEHDITAARPRLDGAGRRRPILERSRTPGHDTVRGPR